MTTATQLASALAALANIAHPPHGLGFNPLRSIARRELASQQLQAIVTKAQLVNADSALANWSPLASGGASAPQDDGIAYRPGDYTRFLADRENADRDARGASGDHNTRATPSRALAECEALADIVGGAS
jgi:hypothetical protein